MLLDNEQIQIERPADSFVGCVRLCGGDPLHIARRFVVKLAAPRLRMAAEDVAAARCDGYCNGYCNGQRMVEVVHGCSLRLGRTTRHGQHEASIRRAQ